MCVELISIQHTHWETSTRTRADCKVKDYCSTVHCKKYTPFKIYSSFLLPTKPKSNDSLRAHSGLTDSLVPVQNMGRITLVQLLRKGVLAPCSS